SERIAAGEARWVTTFRTTNAGYDPVGRLTWSSGYPVQRASALADHGVTVAYDPVYGAFQRVITNSLNQTVTVSYDAAGQLRTSTDDNNQTTTYEYDVYGRPAFYIPPGVGLYQTQIIYGALGPIGVPISKYTYEAPSRMHELRAYFDGFGNIIQTRDYS